MATIARHMDGSTTVLGATATPVPKHWTRFSTTLGDVPVDVAYGPDMGADGYHVLVNGLDVSQILHTWAVRTVEQRIAADEAERAKDANDRLLEDRANDILQAQGGI